MAFMAALELHERLYDEADLWLGSGCTVEINVGGTWISIQRMINDTDGIVKCDTDMGSLWFPLEELKGVREGEAGQSQASTWLPDR
jgi:hypothetical protein